MTMLLNDELLDHFETALRSVRARITTAWAPGISDDEIDRLLAPVDIDLPEEARRWWRWHNGLVAGAPPLDRDLTPRRPLLNLALSVEEYAAARGAMLQVDGVEARLRPVADTPWIYFACDGPRDAPVPIYVSGHAEDQRLVLPSIGELVATWTGLIEQGNFITNPDGTWQWDFETIPPEVARLGIY